MTQEEKQLLLRDFCARLPYRVIAYASEINKNGIITDVNIPYNMVNLTVDNDSGKYELVPLFDIRPYLRSMSSMTEEEKAFVYNGHIEFWIREDYCNKHHLDYRGLLKKDLANEAPEGMYKL